MTSFQYTLIRSKRRRHSAALMVKPDGEIIVQAPYFMPKFLIDQFVKEKSSWITKRQFELKKITSRTKQFQSDEELKQFIEISLSKYQSKMSLYSRKIKFKTVHSYWGNCKIDGTITFNLELIYAPKSAVEYVVIHELAHLKYRGHDKRFWDFVKKYCPTANESRHLLRQIGHDTRNNKS